jgi:hypothetical protein
LDVAVWQWEDAVKRRSWEPKQKSLIVLERLKGRPASCPSNMRSAYQWRDQFLANAAKAFEPAAAR